MNADAVAVVGTINEREGNDDALAAGIDRRQPNDSPNRTGFRQPGMMDVLTRTLEHETHSLSTDESQDMTVLLYPLTICTAFPISRAARSIAVCAVSMS